MWLTAPPLAPAALGLLSGYPVVVPLVGRFSYAALLSSSTVWRTIWFTMFGAASYFDAGRMPDGHRR